MTVDYWAHRHFEDPELRNEILTEDYEADVAEMEAEVLAREAAAEAATKPPDDWEIVEENISPP